MRRIFGFGLLLAVTACGDEVSLAPSAVRVGLQISAEDDVVRRCRVTDGVDRIDVLRADPETEAFLPLRSIDGDAPCRDGLLDLGELDEGIHTVRIEAVGELQGVMRQLFSAEVDLNVGLDGGVEPSAVVLQPDVAYLRINWTPPDDQTAACEPGWTWTYGVEPEAGAGNGSIRVVQADLPCDAPTSRLERPLAPGRYAIEVTMFDADGLPRFERRDMRVLSSGTNTYSALLAPIRGRLTVDWLFVMPGFEPTRDCHAFEVPAVDLIVRSADGGPPLFEQRLDCGVARPTTLTSLEGPLRLPAEAQLELEIVGSGLHRFEGRVEFEMPAGEHELVVSLTPFGQADIAWELTGSECARPAPSRFDVEVVDTELEAVAWSASAPSAETATTTPFLPYGTYEVTVTAPRTGAEGCSGTATHRLESLRAAWPSLPLYLPR